ncbi:MAG: alginate lyase family protein [Thermodesulfobacteriota bacterium]
MKVGRLMRNLQQQGYPASSLLKESAWFVRKKSSAVLQRRFNPALSDAQFFISLGLKGERERCEWIARCRSGGARFYSHDSREAAVRFNGFDRDIVAGADAVCNHRFDILGSGEVNINREGGMGCGYRRVAWSRDFKSGYRWSRERSSWDIVRETPAGTDVKAPWELSRFHHLTLLGQAYRITGDERYATEFVNQLSDWIEDNPVNCGINWVYAMDVAIRAVNWLAGWHFFKGAPSVDDAFTVTLMKSILLHGRFIRRNLEWSYLVRNNHYISNVSGLFIIALLMPDFRESGEWLDFSKGELEREMESQVYPDGCNHEASTAYQRLDLELFLYPAILGRFNGVEFSATYLYRLKTMCLTFMHSLKPDGDMPQVGDNDSGRLLKFDIPGAGPLDGRYLLPLATLFFDEPAFKVNFGTLEEEEALPPYLAPACRLFGEEGLDRWLGMEWRDRDGLESRAFRDAGWYVMRNGGDYMIISCGPNGQRDLGGHAHNDKLSFELSIGGRDIIVDPGTYLYTSHPDERNMFRGTAYHNTVMVDGEEQNRFREGGLFGLHNDTVCRCLHWAEGEDSIEFEGVHYGYRRLEGAIIHKRGITFDKEARRWEIVDNVSGWNSTPHNLRWMLCLHPQVGVEVGADGIIRGDGFSISVTPRVDMRLEEGWYSKGYGLKEPTRTVVFEKRRTVLPFQLTMVIEAFE